MFISPKNKSIPKSDKVLILKLFLVQSPIIIVRIPAKKNLIPAKSDLPAALVISSDAKPILIRGKAIAQATAQKIAKIMDTTFL